MGILSGIGRRKAESDGKASSDPVVEEISRNILKRANKLPETYLSRLVTGSFDEPVPPSGEVRDAWVRRNVERAFAPERGRDVMQAFESKAPGIGAAIEESVRDGALSWFEKASNGTLMGRDVHSMVGTVRAYTANRVVDFMKPGKRLAMRVSREASSLRSAKDETVLERLSDAPISRVDPLPAGGRERTDWIRERLLAEYVSARGGVMTPQAVVAAACRPRGPVPGHDLSELPIVPENERSVVRAHLRGEMNREAGMSDPVLRSRHSGIPGMAAMPLPASGKERMQAIGRILMAELVRGEMRKQDMILAPKKEKTIPLEARSMTRYAPRSRGLGRVEREVVDISPPPAPKPQEKAVVPMGGDRVSAATRYANMLRNAMEKGRMDF